MNENLVKLFEQISEKGISSALAILFCVFIYYEQQSQGEKIEQIGIAIKRFETRQDKILSEMADGWQKYNEELKEKSEFKGQMKSELEVLKSRVNNLERNH